MHLVMRELVSLGSVAHCKACRHVVHIYIVDIAALLGVKEPPHIYVVLLHHLRGFIVEMPDKTVVSGYPPDGTPITSTYTTRIFIYVAAHNRAYIRFHALLHSGSIVNPIPSTVADFMVPNAPQQNGSWNEI
jgi:hypothetical protein